MSIEFNPDIASIYQTQAITGLTAVDKVRAAESKSSEKAAGISTSSTDSTTNRDAYIPGSASAYDSTVAIPSGIYGANAMMVGETNETTASATATDYNAVESTIGNIGTSGESSSVGGSSSASGSVDGSSSAGGSGSVGGSGSASGGGSDSSSDTTTQIVTVNGATYLETTTTDENGNTTTTRTLISPAPQNASDDAQVGESGPSAAAQALANGI